MLVFLGSIALVVILLLSEMPIAFAFGIGALVFGLASGSDISFLIPFAYQTTSSFALLALPLFVMAGTIMAEGGMSDRLLNFVNALVGRLKGGLGAVTIVTCALFGAISGSSSAAIAAIGSIMIPRMVREGYPPGHATALVACSSVLALMIPPSIPMIVFAVTGGISVGAAFLSTVIPGVLLTIVYVGLNFLFLRKVKDDQGRGAGPGPRRGPQGRHDGRQGLLGAPAAGLHPGQHLLRHRDADRGRRDRLRLHGRRRLRVLSRTSRSGTSPRPSGARRSRPARSSRCCSSCSS